MPRIWGPIDFTCPKCGQAVNVPASVAGQSAVCPRSGRRILVPIPGPPPGAVSPFDTETVRAVFGLAGSGLLLIGVLMPVIQGPLGMYADYFWGGQGGGVIAILGAVAVFFSLVRFRIGVGALSVSILLLLTYDFVTIVEKLRDLEEELSRRRLDALADEIGLGWALILLWLGAAFVVVAAALPKKPKSGNLPVAWRRR